MITTRDLRLSVGYLLMLAALGAMIVFTGALLHTTPAHGATMVLTNDGQYRTAAGAPSRVERRTGRIRHHARGGRHGRIDRGVPLARHAGDPRPSRWCGWYLRRKLGVADRKFNLARNWAQLGRPSGPGPGVVVVWRSHVGVIVRITGPGRAVVESGNDGGTVRVRERSISKAIAFRAV